VWFRGAVLKYRTWGGAVLILILIEECVMKRFVYSVMFGLAVIFAAGLSSGCDDAINGVTDDDGTDNSDLPLTEAVLFVSGEENITGTMMGTSDDVGTWELSVVEEPRAVFAVSKTAAQTITKGGRDAAMVTVAADGAKYGDGSVKKIDNDTGEADPEGPTVYVGYTAGASIYYTLDGSVPASNNPGSLYSGPIALSVDTVINAVARKSGMRDSDVFRAEYTVVSSMAATPVADPAAGVVEAGR
jgi:hypothetical protein